MKKALIAKLTSDGSLTLFSSVFNQHYHSVFGAETESKIVFIDLGLRQYPNYKEEVSVFEMGLGTGLNAALTRDYANKNRRKISYTAIEAFPITDTSLFHPNSIKLQNLDKFQHMDYLQNLEWGACHNLDPYFSFKKLHQDLVTHKFEHFYDIIFYDAFAPEVQPELWTVDVFKKIFDAVYFTPAEP